MESFVDLSYRGLSLGRRIKLTQVRPTTGYLETAAPMPVGSTISIATDEGHAIEAIVTAVQEQTANVTGQPGMRVTPALAGEVATWWSERASPEPVAEPVPARAKPATVRPRSDTMVDTTPTGAPVAPSPDAPTAPALRPSDPLMASLAAASHTVAQSADLEHGGRTIAMQAMPDPDEPVGRRTGEHAVVDDGKATQMMDAIDISALGLDLPESGPVDTSDDEIDVRASSPGLPTTKKRKKRTR